MTDRRRGVGSRDQLRNRVLALKDAVSGARKSLIGASFVIVQPLLLNVISLPVTAYIIAVLGPHHYGQWSVALTMITSTAILTNLGLRSFFIRGVAQHPETARKAFSEQLGLRMCLAVLAGLFSLLVCRLLGYPAEILRCTAILAIGAVFTAAAAVVSDLLSATERLPSLATINFAAGLLLTAASAVAMWLGGGPLGLAGAYLVGPLMTGTLSLLLIQRRMFPVSVSGTPRRYWELLKQAKILGLQLFVMNLGNHAENLLVPKLVGISAYGYFAAGTLLPRRMEVVSDGLNTAFYPVLARSYQQSPAQALVTVKRLGLFMCAACLPAAIALTVFADPIARLLFPDSPDICRTVIRITIWWLPLIGLAYAMGYAINAARLEREEARIAISSTVASLVLSVILIQAFGLLGACYALVGRAALALAFRIPCFLRTLRPPQVAAANPAPAGELIG